MKWLWRKLGAAVARRFLVERVHACPSCGYSARERVRLVETSALSTR